MEWEKEYRPPITLKRPRISPHTTRENLENDGVHYNFPVWHLLEFSTPGGNASECQLSERTRMLAFTRAFLSGGVKILMFASILPSRKTLANTRILKDCENT